MQKRVFSFVDAVSFKKELSKFKESYCSTTQGSLFFHIHSAVIDEARLRSVWTSIEDIFPGVPWLGNSTSGNIVDCEQSAEISVTATLFEKASTRFKLFQYDMKSTSVEKIAQSIVADAQNNPWVKAIEMHYTISDFSTTKICDGLHGLRNDIQVFGGIVCSMDITSSDSCVFSSVGGFNPHGLLIMFYGGDEFFVESIKISGWKPLGRNFHVTRANGSTLYELGGVPAYDIYRKYLNIGNDENFFYNALEFPLLYEHNGTTIVRAPAASNPDGSLSMSSDIDVESIVRLSYGEPQTILESIRQEGERIKKFKPDVMHIFSCAARKAFWSSHEPTYELLPIKNIAESVGFFSHGEFIREKGHLNQHNITLVIASMREGCGREELTAAESTSKKQSKLPLAARMATFIRETSFELEEMNSKLQVFNRQLQDLATTDSLTGLENRLAFDEMLKGISNEEDLSANWVMVMIDVNGLKYTNDTFGHLAGDALIVAAGKAISSAFADVGSCFRIGGDEFVVLVKADHEQLYRLRNKLKKSVDEYNKDALYRLSMAVGESFLKNDMGVRKSISDWKLDADLNMYHDKVSSHHSRETSENQNLRELVSCLISIEEAKDSYTAHHSDRVQEISNMLSKALGLSESTQHLISDAALLHDIGKVGVSDAILSKPGRLTNEEFSVIKQHPVIGARILMQSNYTQELVQIVLHHHERYDGLGYPEGLAGDDIPIGARIIAIADSIDAMTSKRCYRDALSLDFCRSEIEKNLGIMYDPAIAKVALDHWDEIADKQLVMMSGHTRR